MTNIDFSIIMAVGSVLAGLLGALSGLGGGVIVVPLLVIAMGVDVHYAIGTSLIAVIATSSGASAAYVKEGFSNIRVGLLLETATTVGAITGTILSTIISAPYLFVIFGLVLIYSVLSTRITHHQTPDSVQKSDPISNFFKLDSFYRTNGEIKKYRVFRIPLGYFIMFVAGTLSGLLGIGSGALKVVAMDRAMKIPFKVSTTTSNFMIGVTAAASAGIYLKKGYIDPTITMPVVIGIIIGSLIGARLLPTMRTSSLRTLFAILVLAIAAQMIYKGIVRMMA